MEEYSTAADAWVERAPLAAPVSHFAAAYLDSQIIAFGGQDACTTVALCSNGCELNSAQRSSRNLNAPAPCLACTEMSSQCTVSIGQG